MGRPTWPTGFGGVQWHSSPESIFHAHWRPVLEGEGADMSEVLMGAVTEEGDAVEVRPADMLAAIRKQGMWGFCDEQSGVVHLWAQPKSSRQNVARLIGHELAHLLDDLPSRDHPEVEDELFADAIGDVVALAMLILAARPTTPDTKGGTTDG